MLSEDTEIAKSMLMQESYANVSTDILIRRASLFSRKLAFMLYRYGSRVSIHVKYLCQQLLGHLISSAASGFRCTF
jgi:hypothetical protein